MKKVTSFILLSALIAITAVFSPKTEVKAEGIYEEIGSLGIPAPTQKFRNVFYGSENYLNKRYDVEIDIESPPPAFVSYAGKNYTLSKTTLHYDYGTVEQQGESASNWETTDYDGSIVKDTFYCLGLSKEGRNLYFRSFITYEYDGEDGNLSLTSGVANSLDFKCDMTAPQIDDIEAEYDKIKVNASDAVSGVYYYGYVMDNETSEPTNWVLGNEFTVDKHGIYYFYVKDRAGNISLKFPYTYKLAYRSIQAATVEYKNSFVYNGQSIVPELTVKYGGEVLKPGTDYTAEFDNNESAGTASIKITGTGIYYGEVLKYYNINKVTPDVTFADTMTKNKSATSFYVTYAVNNLNKDYYKVSFHSSNTKIAEVEDSGLVTLKGKIGKCRITGTIEGTDNVNEKKFDVTLRVVPNNPAFKLIRSKKKVTVRVTNSLSNITKFKIQYCKKEDFSSGVKTVYFKPSKKGKKVTSITREKTINLKTKSKFYFRVYAITESNSGELFISDTYTKRK